MFNYDDPIGQFRTSRILNPMANRNRQQIQEATASPESQFSDAFQSGSSALDGAEELAAKSGGVFFDKENMRRYMDAIDANETAPKPRQMALSQHLDKQPKREDYEPSTGGRLGAALVGFGTGYTQGPTAGLKAGRDIVDAPYRDARQDWMDRTGPLEYGANLEEKGVKDRTSGLIRNASMGVKFDEAQRKRTEDIDKHRKTEIEIKNIESEISNRDNGYIGAPFPNAQTGQMMILRKQKGGEPVPIKLGVTSLAWDEFQEKKKQSGISNRQEERKIDIAGRNAGANESRAKSAATSAATGQGNLEERKSQDEKILPAHQLEASQTALALLEHEYPKFVTTSPTGHHVIEPLDESQAQKDPNYYQAYHDFLERYSRYQAAIAAGRPQINMQDIPLPKPRIPRDKN